MPAPMPAPSPPGEWQVMLGGTFVPYESSVQLTLETAYRSGQPTAEVLLRGTLYTIELRGAKPMQVNVQDPAKRRQVRRVPP